MAQIRSVQKSLLTEIMITLLLPLQQQRRMHQSQMGGMDWDTRALATQGTEIAVRIISVWTLTSVPSHTIMAFPSFITVINMPPAQIQWEALRVHAMQDTQELVQHVLLTTSAH